MKINTAISFILTLAALLSMPKIASAARLSTLMGSAGGSTITFSGYTPTYNGNLGGLKGANQKCATAYAGSHVCSTDEITALGSSYPYTDAIWWLDGVLTVGIGGDGGYAYLYTKLGYYGAWGGGLYDFTCSQWNSTGATYGLTLSTSGVGSLINCTSSAKLACCK